MPQFVRGRELARAYYDEVVRELVGDVEHSAALLGWGSDVLGFDTERSTDHGWGPRLQVFVHASDVERVRSAVEAALPDEFRGWPTRYGWDDVPVSSHVDVGPLGEWLQRQLGADPRAGLTTLQWLTTPQQLLSEITTGEVFWDGTGENPYVDLLALADFIVATADSFNMIGEAAATGRPILVFGPSGGHPKLDVYMSGLKSHGVVHPFEGRLEGQPYEPLDSTPKVAKAIAEGFIRHRRTLGLPDIAFPLETP